MTEARDDVPESPYEWLSLIGVLVGGLAVAFAVVMVKSGWVAAGLLVVERMASAVNWRSSRRPLVGQALALAGIASSIAILAVDRDMWWMLFLIWFWYGERVYYFFRAPGASDEPEVEGLSEREKKIIAVMRRFEVDDFSVIPEIDPDQQQDLRAACRVPPEDRVLALKTWNFSGAEAFSMVVASSGVYFHWQGKGSEDVRSIRFEEFPARTFVNHGRSVYIGDGQNISPHPERGADYCDMLCNVLNALKTVV